MCVCVSPLLFWEASSLSKEVVPRFLDFKRSIPPPNWEAAIEVPVCSAGWL